MHPPPSRRRETCHHQWKRPWSLPTPCASTQRKRVEQEDHCWLVVWTPLKNIGQLGWLFPIYGKIKNVPNHQPDWDVDPETIGTSNSSNYRNQSFRRPFAMIPRRANHKKGSSFNLPEGPRPIPSATERWCLPSKCPSQPPDIGLMGIIMI